MPQCKGLYLCLSGFPKVLPCSSGPVSHPPRSIRTGYCAVMAQMPDGENLLSSMYHYGPCSLRELFFHRDIVLPRFVSHTSI